MQQSRNDLLMEFQRFLQTPVEEKLSTASLSQAEQEVLGLFHAAARRVPAYGRFLAEQGVEVDQVQDLPTFCKLPPVTRENYLRRYPLPERCWDGRLDRCEMVAVSSGSTGTPLFWPRSAVDELGIAVRFEQIFVCSFEARRWRTLAVVCFAMGTWVGGMFTATCCRYLSQKGYAITLVTPGNQKEEIFRCVTELGPFFDQVVLLGYPPFLKDVVDTGLARGLDWAQFHVKLVMAGEVFSEEWRSLVADRLGQQDIIRGSASLYGTADAGVLGNETPLSIQIRRMLAERPEAARQLFGESRLPTLVQYDPRSRFFEAENGSLIFSGENGAPLLRYQIADTGGIMSFQALLQFLKQMDLDPLGVPGRVDRVFELPFVYVFGRSDFTVSYFGANIYPENITVGLEEAPVPEWVTGKFVLRTQEDADKNRSLQVAVELLPGVTSTREREALIGQSILRHLRRLNSEFSQYVPEEFQAPVVELKPFGDPEWFPAGVKHRYTRR